MGARPHAHLFARLPRLSLNMYKMIKNEQVLDTIRICLI